MSVRPSVRLCVCLSVFSSSVCALVLSSRADIGLPYHGFSHNQPIHPDLHSQLHNLFYFNLNFNLKYDGTLFTFYSIRIFSNFVLSTHETHCNIAFCQIPSGGVHVRYSGCDRQSVGRLGEEHRWTMIHPIKYRHLVLSCDTPTLSFLPSNSYPTSCHPSNFSLWNLLPYDIIRFISHDFYPD